MEGNSDHFSFLLILDNDVEMTIEMKWKKKFVIT